MKKVLLLPGWMESLKLYENSENFNVRIGILDEEAACADCVIGISLSSLVILKNIDRINGKIILINPPLPKRNILIWFVRWVRFVATEGLFFERQKFTRNPIKIFSTLLDCTKLLGIDFAKTLDTIPKDRLMIIRGKNDKFFCDDRTVEFANSKDLKIIEVNGGHNWSEEVERMLLTI